jgi:hypothetical protein
MGGHVHLDCGGAGLLFIIGGVIGLIFLAVYKKGFSKGQEIAPDPHRRSPSLWTCLACGTDNAPAAKICQNCHEPR